MVAETLILWPVLFGLVLQLTLGAPGDPEVFSGSGNTNSGPGAVILGGVSNTVDATATSSAILGGDANSVESENSVIVGGHSNRVTGGSTSLQTLIAGQYNRVTAKQATVLGGRTNRAKSRYATIGGGYNNLITARFGAIAGGSSNTVRGKFGAVLGNFGAVRADYSLMVNLLGTRQLVETENTVMMNVATMKINGHDVEAVYNEVLRRELRAGSEFADQIDGTSLATIEEHSRNQLDLLSMKVAELHQKVSELGNMMHTQSDGAERRQRSQGLEFAFSAGRAPVGSEGEVPHLLPRLKGSSVTIENSKSSVMQARRRLINVNSDYPTDGSMEQEYHETMTARMDDIAERIVSLDSRLTLQQTYFDGGYLIGEFDCSPPVSRVAYGEGPCNICGGIPRLQYRTLDPLTLGSAILVCDGKGTDNEFGDVIVEGSWLKLV